jgi:hypothetical protein
VLAAAQTFVLLISLLAVFSTAVMLRKRLWLSAASLFLPVLGTDLILLGGTERLVALAVLGAVLELAGLACYFARAARTSR